MNQEIATIRGQIAAHTRWSKAGPKQRTEHGAKGQAGLMARFEREVDPNNELPEAERRQRAESLRKAYMARLVMARHRARQAREAADRLADELGAPDE
jgi:hypothetical protein